MNNSNSKETKINTKKILEKYDAESRPRNFVGIKRNVVRYLLVIFAIYSILLNFYFTFDPRVSRASFVAGLVFFSYILYPFKSKKKNKEDNNTIPIYDLILAILSSACYFYFVFNYQEIIKLGMQLTNLEIFIGIIGILTTLEACRRVTGIPIVIVSSVFILYGLTESTASAGRFPVQTLEMIMHAIKISRE